MHELYDGDYRTLQIVYKLYVGDYVDEIISDRSEYFQNC